jgi:hypothetical protein
MKLPPEILRRRAEREAAAFTGKYQFAAAMRSG